MRIAGLADAEIVLKKRPLHLFIEVPGGSADLPVIDGRKIYKLMSQCRQWNVDRAGAIKILRHGYSIVPDFGGTAHAYGGTALDACLGDVPAWSAKPTRAADLRGYVIKSRVKRAQNILLAQPYWPHLFRQGDLPGPTLLMKALQKELILKNAQGLAGRRTAFGTQMQSTQAMVRTSYIAISQVPR